MTLAARVDSFHQSTDGGVGVAFRLEILLLLLLLLPLLLLPLAFREEIARRVDKLQEAPSSKAVRTLPVPRPLLPPPSSSSSSSSSSPSSLNRCR